MKSIFLTGISSGIGLDATRLLIENGYRVIGTVRKEADKQNLIEQFPENLDILIMDVTDYEKVEKIPEHLYQILRNQPLTALINNAGIAEPGPLMYLEDDRFVKQIEVNVMAVRKMTNTLLPFLGMKEDFAHAPGKIINISSISGLFNSPFNGAYCISKHALESMSEVYRRELIPFGIDVIAIQPGPIKTKIWQKNIGTLERFRKTEFKSIVDKADNMIMNSEKNALPVEVISKLILKIIDSKNPKSHYLVHKNKWIFKFLTGWMPTRIVDKLIWKKLKGGDSYRPV